MANTAAKKITYDGKPVQVESAVRDGTGKNIVDTYLAKANATIDNDGVITLGSATIQPSMLTQLGGTSRTYTISATGYKTIAQVSSASQFWTVNGGNSHIKMLIEYSSLSSPASTATTTKLGEWIVDVAFSGTVADVFAVSENGNAGNNDGVLRYFAAYSPKTTSYCPQIAVQNYSSTSTYVKVTILSCTLGWQLPASLGGDPGTTNYTRYTYEMGRYNYTWSGNKIAANITGSCDGTAGSAWDSIKNDRFYAGASAVWYHKNSSNTVTQYAIVNTRPFGTASDGKVYHLSTPDKAFMLPFTGGRALANYGLGSTSTTPWMVIRGITTTELTNTNVANNANLSASTTYSGTGTAYAYNWVFRTHTNSTTWSDATTLAIGKNMYICGNLDASGNFVPYYTSATGQTISVPKDQGGFTAATNVKMQKYTFYITQNPTWTANYNTFLFFAKADKANNAFSYWTYGATAYTYNSSGKLTHIDGKAIKDASASGVYYVPTGSQVYAESMNIITTTTTPAAITAMSLDTNCVPSYSKVQAMIPNLSSTQVTLTET